MVSYNCASAAALLLPLPPPMAVVALTTCGKRLGYRVSAVRTPERSVIAALHPQYNNKRPQCVWSSVAALNASDPAIQTVC